MGMVAIFQSTLSILTIVVSLFLPAAINVRYFKQESLALPDYIGTGVILSAIAATLIFTLGLLFKVQIRSYTDLTFTVFCIALLCSVFQLYIDVELKLAQAKGEALRYTVFQNSVTVLIMTISVGLIIGAGIGWEGRVWGQFIAVFLAGSGIFFSLFSKREISFRWNSVYAQEILKFGLPLLPHGISAISMVFLTRLILRDVADLHEVGLYMVAAQLAGAITIVASAVNQAYAPWLYKILSGSQSLQLKKKIVIGTYLNFLLIFTGSIIYFFSLPPFIGMLLGQNYIGTIAYLPWLIAGSALNSMYFLVTNYLFYHQKTGRLALATVGSCVLSVVLSLILTPTQGGVGVAQAFMAANGFLFLVTWILAANVQSMPWIFFGSRNHE